MPFVAALTDLKSDVGTEVEVDGKKIILILDGDQVRAFQGECPHAKAPLAGGAVCNRRLVCPWHKATFAISDGALLEPPALQGLQRYAVRVEAGRVFTDAEPIGTAVGAASAKPGAGAPAAQSDPRTFVVVGGGAAGTAGVAALREAGFKGTVAWFGREPGQPFDRTALSKFVLSGDMPPNKVPPLLDADFLTHHDLKLDHTEVTRLDALAHRLELADGRSLNFDAALLTPGADPRQLNVPGADLKGVQVLRSITDAETAVEQLDRGGEGTNDSKKAQERRHAVILGDSFIGLEVASALRKRNLAVTVVSPDEIPFVKQFGAQFGRVFKRLHERNGVKFEVGEANRFEGGRVLEAVRLKSGKSLPADFAIVGVGVQPATGFIDGLDLAEDGGVRVDQYYQAAPGIFAAGDIAQFALPSGNKPLRIEHWRVAQQHGRIAALNMLGGRERYTSTPFFWTFHYGKRFEYIGHASEWDQVRVDGDPDAQDFLALFIRSEHVVAALACNRERATAWLVDAMAASLPVEPAWQRLLELSRVD